MELMDLVQSNWSEYKRRGIMKDLRKLLRDCDSRNYRFAMSDTYDQLKSAESV